MKIAVMGYSGSGKSTLAEFLSERLNVPILYLDTVQFEAGWKERDRVEAVSIVSEFMKKDSWVIDGNYQGFLQRERLETADYIIYLNFSRMNCLFRALKRYFKNRNTTRTSVAEGCVEKFDFEFFLWIIYKGRTKDVRRHYSSIVSKYVDKTVVIKNQRQLTRFMDRVGEDGFQVK